MGEDNNHLGVLTAECEWVKDAGECRSYAKAEEGEHDINGNKKAGGNYDIHGNELKKTCYKKQAWAEYGDQPNLGKDNRKVPQPERVVKDDKGNERTLPS